MHYNGLPKATKENARNFFSKAALLAWEQCILYHLTNQSLEQNFAWKSANLPISVRRGLTPLPDSEKIVWCRDRRLLHIVFVKAAPSKAWRHGWPAAKICRALLFFLVLLPALKLWGLLLVDLFVWLRETLLEMEINYFRFYGMVWYGMGLIDWLIYM